MKSSTFGTRFGTTQTRINTGFAPPCPNVLMKINNIIINFINYYYSNRKIRVCALKSSGHLDKSPKPRINTGLFLSRWSNVCLGQIQNAPIKASVKDVGIKHT